MLSLPSSPITAVTAYDAVCLHSIRGCHRHLVMLYRWQASRVLDAPPYGVDERVCFNANICSGHGPVCGLGVRRREHRYPSRIVAPAALPRVPTSPWSFESAWPPAGLSGSAGGWSAELGVAGSTADQRRQQGCGGVHPPGVSSSATNTARRLSKFCHFLKISQVGKFIYSTTMCSIS